MVPVALCGGGSAIPAHVTWLKAEVWWDALGDVNTAIAALCATIGVLYWLTQRAVRVDLEPRRRELLSLLAGLQEEVADECSEELDDASALTHSYITTNQTQRET